MRTLIRAVVTWALAGSALPAQVVGKWPPDSLVNVHVIPKTTPVVQVVGQMRNITGALGVRCSYCHVGEESQSLEQYDLASDAKRPKLVARQMMRMVQDINRRLDSLPGGRGSPATTVTCATCHRGVARPVPLSALMTETAVTVNADSALSAYRALRQRYYGRDAYDFSESALNIAAFRTSQRGKPDDALALLRYNEELFPGSSGMYVFRGNILLMKGDTNAAATAFREAVRRDTANAEAKGRLRAIGRQP
jgi:tetratricopeptide (TPR) repeat protein